MLKVYGASDDLIEVEGDVREEINADRAYLVTDTGVILYIRYSESGIWRIIPALNASSVELDFCIEDDGERYSDIAVIPHDVSWFVCGDVFAKAK